MESTSNVWHIIDYNVCAMGAIIFATVLSLLSGAWEKEIGIKMDKTQSPWLLNQCKYSGQLDVW